MFLRSKLQPRQRVTPRVHCYDIEKKRVSLTHGFYGLQREISTHEIEIILKPLFQNINVSVNLVNNQVVVEITNAEVSPKENVSEYVIDLVNEWNSQERLRRFLVKSLTAANKNNMYRYEKNVTWKCPLDVHYVFCEDDTTGDEFESSR